MSGLPGPGRDAAGTDVAILVTVADAHLGALDDVRAQLQDAGMHVERVLGAVGVITGSAPPGWEDLTRLDCVAGVEADRTITLPPPGEPQ